VDDPWDDLLEACKQYLSRYNHVAAVAAVEEWGEPDWVVAMRAAIAKIEGKP
jgi:hypothetical protein